MTTPDDAAETWDLLRRFIGAIGPYNDQTVLVGGLLTHLYPYHPDFRPSILGALATKDVDFAIANNVPIPTDDTTIHQRLIAGGFKEFVVSGFDHKIIDVKFHRPAPGEEGALAKSHVEFISPLIGSSGDVLPANPQYDLTVPRLRYVDLLLHDCVRIDVAEVGQLRVPNPLTFIIQKTLIRGERRAQLKADKDQADVVFAVLGFQNQWQRFRGALSDMRSRSPDWSSWVKRAAKDWRILYANASSEGSLEVARYHQTSAGRTVDPLFVSETMKFFCEDVISW